MRLKEIIVRPLRESLDSQRAAGRYNHATVVKFAGRRHVLQIGESDAWALYYADKDRDRVYCVNINRRHDYVGVQAYDHEDQEPREELSIFMQGTGHIDEALVPDALDRLTDRAIARRLIESLWLDSWGVLY
jgi:hypothetical protein